MLNYWCILHASVEHTVGTNSVSVAAVRRLDEIFKSVLGNCICLVTYFLTSGFNNDLLVYVVTRPLETPDLLDLLNIPSIEISFCIASL